MPDKPADTGRAVRDETSLSGIGVKRPLVLIVLALMAGLVAAAWGFQVPETWLVAGLVGLLAALVLLYVCGAAPKAQDRQGHENQPEAGPDTSSES